MNYLDQCSYKIIIDFLEIQEYMVMLTVSKLINNESNRYRKFRVPHIIVYNDCYGGFSISDECILLMKQMNESNEEMRNTDKFYRDLDRDDKFLVQAILKLGSIKASGRYARLQLRAFPLMFKNFTKIDEYDGTETPSISDDGYRYHMIDKCKKKIDNIMD